MPTEGKKRPARIPKTAEQIAELILLKKLREHKRVEVFKKTRFYKFANIFNLISFFVYCELIFCFFGPCHYQVHYSRFVKAEYGDEKINGIRKINSLQVTSVNDKYCEFVIHDFIDKPAHRSRYFIGKDFLFQKELKGGVSTSENTHAIYQAGSPIFLAFFLLLFSCVVFGYNLNQNPHSLRAITIMNAFTLFALWVV